MISWNRYYDPSTGRYISADPIGLAGGMNLYSYVLNNPVNWVDPWGLYSKFGFDGLIEEKIIEKAKEYGVCIDPSIEKEVAEALREAATDGQVDKLTDLQKQYDKKRNELPYTKDGNTRQYGPKEWDILQNIKQEQRKITKDIVDKVKNEHPEWKDKIKDCCPQ